MAVADTKPILIYSDIETDTFQATKVLQIAAITCKGDIFNVHLNPNTDLPLHCTNITGLYYYRGNLYKNGRLVPSISIKKGLRDFKKWLLSFNQPIHLIYHNAFSFDAKIIIKQFLKHNIKFPENVLMIHDTLPAFRKVLTEISDHRLATLAEYNKVELINAHDALADSTALKEICETFVKTKSMDIYEFLNSYVKPVEFFIKKEKENLEKNGRK
jgi:DNA polymerase III alpha subunit (gram-positive type)